MAQLDAGQQMLRYREVMQEQRDTVTELVTRRCPSDSQDLIEMLGLDKEYDNDELA